MDKINDIVNNLSEIGDNQVTKTLLVILGALIAQIVIKSLIEKTLRLPLNNDLFPKQKADREKRIKTLTSISVKTAVFGIWFIAFVLIMGIYRIPIGPLLTSAGLIGAAIAFGMQSLIKDFISGIFIISENQYRIDDYIQLDKVSGKVEAITVRTTVIRDKNGSLHHVPNGTITLTTNLSMGPLAIVEQLEVDSSETIDRIKQKVSKISETLQTDVALSKIIKDGPKVVGITKINSKSMVIEVAYTTTAAKQDKAKILFWNEIKKSSIKLA